VEEAAVTICIAVSRAVIAGKFNTGTEGVKERRQLTLGVMIDTSSRSRDIMIANRIKVFKFCLLNACKREYGI
jgi:hypothetical protein